LKTIKYNYIINRNGSSLSEKIYLLHNSIGKCKVCENSVKFLSIERGYREYCSKKCSNNDKELIDSKLKSYKKTCMSKWGVDNSSKSDNVKTKIKESKKNINYELVNKRSKETFLKNWGVDNPSKSETIKQKKRETNLNNWGVDNPFQSEEIKEKIREKNIERFGFNHPLKSIEIKERIKETNIKKYGVDNFTKTKEYKELIFEKYRSGLIKTNLNTDINYHSYIGLGRHLLKCDIGHDHIYETNSHLYHSRIGRTQCTVCYPVNSTSSFKEKELYDFIKLIYSGEIITSYRSGLEIDIYLPELKIGFEFNGLYWHSELFKDKNYHLDKTKYFKEKGITRLLSKNDMIKLSYKTALKIFKNNYWDQQELSTLKDQDVANIIYDGCVNQGVDGMRSVLRDALEENGIEISDSDIIFSKEILSKANEVDQEKLFDSIKKFREERYRDSKTFNRHGEGWLNRLDAISYKGDIPEQDRV